MSRRDLPEFEDRVRDMLHRRAGDVAVGDEPQLPAQPLHASEVEVVAAARSGAKWVRAAAATLLVVVGAAGAVLWLRSGDAGMENAIIESRGRALPEALTSQLPSWFDPASAPAVYTSDLDDVRGVVDEYLLDRTGVRLSNLSIGDPLDAGDLVRVPWSWADDQEEPWRGELVLRPLGEERGFEVIAALSEVVDVSGLVVDRTGLSGTIWFSESDAIVQFDLLTVDRTRLPRPTDDEPPTVSDEVPPVGNWFRATSDAPISGALAVLQPLDRQSFIVFGGHIGGALLSVVEFAVDEELLDRPPKNVVTTEDRIANRGWLDHLPTWFDPATAPIVFQSNESDPQTAVLAYLGVRLQEPGADTVMVAPPVRLADGLWRAAWEHRPGQDAPSAWGDLVVRQTPDGVGVVAAISDRIRFDRLELRGGLLAGQISFAADDHPVALDLLDLERRPLGDPAAEDAERREDGPAGSFYRELDVHNGTGSTLSTTLPLRQQPWLFYGGHVDDDGRPLSVVEFAVAPALLPPARDCGDPAALPPDLQFDWVPLEGAPEGGHWFALGGFAEVRLSWFAEALEPLDSGELASAAGSSVHRQTVRLPLGELGCDVVTVDVVTGDEASARSLGEQVADMLATSDVGTLVLAGSVTRDDVPDIARCTGPSGETPVRSLDVDAPAQGFHTPSAALAALWEWLDETGMTMNGVLPLPTVDWTVVRVGTTTWLAAFAGPTDGEAWAVVELAELASGFYVSSWRVADWEACGVDPVPWWPDPDGSDGEPSANEPGACSEWFDPAAETSDDVDGFAPRPPEAVAVAVAFNRASGSTARDVANCLRDVGWDVVLVIESELEADSFVAYVPGSLLESQVVAQAIGFDPRTDVVSLAQGAVRFADDVESAIAGAHVVLFIGPN